MPLKRVGNDTKIYREEIYTSNYPPARCLSLHIEIKTWPKFIDGSKTYVCIWHTNRRRTNEGSGEKRRDVLFRFHRVYFPNEEKKKKPERIRVSFRIDTGVCRYAIPINIILVGKKEKKRVWSNYLIRFWVYNYTSASVY